MAGSRLQVNLDMRAASSLPGYFPRTADSVRPSASALVEVGSPVHVRCDGRIAVLTKTCPIGGSDM
jgi:hypothetical protein